MAGSHAAEAKPVAVNPGQKVERIGSGMGAEALNIPETSLGTVRPRNGVPTGGLLDPYTSDPARRPEAHREGLGHP